MSKKSNRFSPEVRERAVRMVLEHRGEYLEGTGKGRRHVKLMSASQIQDKKLAQYLSLALQAAKQENS